MDPPSTVSPPPPVYTAMVYHHQGDDADDVASMLTQPLMSFDDDDDSQFGKQYSNTSSSRQIVVKSDASNFPRALIVGAVVGFVVQVVSLLAYRTILLRWDDDDSHRTTSSELSTAENESGCGLVHIMLSLLTQLDLIMYVMIWLAFTCTVTKTGMSMLRRISCATTEGSPTAVLSRRVFFFLGVYFLVGIVLGAFVAWTMTDYYLGFPVPFLPIASTVAFDLFLCYLMIQCYDCLGSEDDEDDAVDLDVETVGACC